MENNIFVFVAEKQIIGVFFLPLKLNQVKIELNFFLMEISYTVWTVVINNDGHTLALTSFHTMCGAKLTHIVFTWSNIEIKRKNVKRKDSHSQISKNNRLRQTVINKLARKIPSHLMKEKNDSRYRYIPWF